MNSHFGTPQAAATVLAVSADSPVLSPEHIVAFAGSEPVHTAGTHVFPDFTKPLLQVNSHFGVPQAVATVFAVFAESPLLSPVHIVALAGSVPVHTFGVHVRYGARGNVGLGVEVKVVPAGQLHSVVNTPLYMKDSWAMPDSHDAGTIERPDFEESAKCTSEDVNGVDALVLAENENATAAKRSTAHIASSFFADLDREFRCE